MTETARPAHRPANLEATELQEWMGQNSSPRIIDVRTPGEFHSSHIPGSYNVPLDLLKEHRHELVTHLEDHVVLVCRSGARASQAEQLFVEASTTMPQLHVLQGGLTAWERAGATVVRGAAKWELERQVRLVAGGLVLAAILVSVVLPWTKWFAAAIGAGLTMAALTNSCLMGMMLAKLPYNRETSPSVEDAIRDLREG